MTTQLFENLKFQYVNWFSKQTVKQAEGSSRSSSGYLEAYPPHARALDLWAWISVSEINNSPFPLEMGNSSKQNLHDVEARHTREDQSARHLGTWRENKLRAILTGKNRNAFKGIQYFSLRLLSSTANNFHHFLWNKRLRYRGRLQIAYKIPARDTWNIKYRTSNFPPTIKCTKIRIRLLCYPLAATYTTLSVSHHNRVTMTSVFDTWNKSFAL